MNIDKDKIRDLIVSALEESYRLSLKSAQEARNASTHADAKAENKYDTRGLEASYLADAQSKRASEIMENTAKLRNLKLLQFSEDDAVQQTALVNVASGDSLQRWLFILPVGGVEVNHEGYTIQSLTEKTPLATLILGKYLGDTFKFNDREYEIQNIF